MFLYLKIISYVTTVVFTYINNRYYVDTKYLNLNTSKETEYTGELFFSNKFIVYNINNIILLWVLMTTN